MSKTIFAATALAVLALAPIAAATSAHAQQQPPTYRIPKDPDPTPSVDTPCTHELGFLRRVRAEELAPVTEKHKVWVMPICINEDSAFRNAGNVGKLRMAIAANAAMKQALGEKAFSAHDVVGIRKTATDKAILYVIPSLR